ncbi:DgyrCDS14381 [Dimorphilus gyrociliatus]|uniref:DgyrCDS14381 n=1 Tax=Dimorphilus gyrociliatus TaxID=2664684 RepID=A0A7I8WDE5_9ANNE|nr:DgyrCDS14381 [Dimorphilus gyrociliatus]
MKVIYSVLILFFINSNLNFEYGSADCNTEVNKCLEPALKGFNDITNKYYYDMDKICPFMKTLQNCAKDNMEACTNGTRDSAIEYSKKICGTDCKKQLVGCNVKIKNMESTKKCCEISALKQCGALNSFSTTYIYPQTCAGSKPTLYLITILLLMTLIKKLIL